MGSLIVLAFVWALIYAMLFLPARKAGKWVARPADGWPGTALSITCCAVLAWGVVFFVWLALRVGGRELIFPNVKADYFGLFYAAILLFVPAFIALITGYLHARMAAGRRTLVSLLPARLVDVLANFFALAVGVALLGFAGRSLLKWYSAGKQALSPTSLIVPFMVLLLLAVGFIVERSTLTKRLKSVTRAAVLIVTLAASYYVVRTNT